MNFKYYDRDTDPDMKQGFIFESLNDLNQYFDHGGSSLTVHDLVLKSYGMHYKSKNTLFQVHTKKLQLIGYLELLK